MKVRRYFANDMRTALAMVREQQGPDVIILSNRRVDGGVEILTSAGASSSTEVPGAVRPQQSDPSGQVIGLASQPPPATIFADEEFSVDPPVNIRSNVHRPADPSPALRDDGPRSGLRAPTLEDNRTALASGRPDMHGEAPSSSAQRGPRMAEASTAARAELWTDRRLVEDMRGELTRMRRLIEEELPGLAWASLGTHNPLMARLLRRCVAAGLSPRLSRDLVRELAETRETEAWLECLARLGMRLRLLGDRLARGGGWHILLGPTGVGKTTLAVKLAAREVLAGRGHHLHLVGLDHRRVGAPEQLRAYARVLGLTVHEPTGTEEMLNLAEKFGPDDRVIVDTAGVVPGMPQPPWLAALVEERHSCLRHWVLPAPSERRVLERMAATARDWGVEACSLTRLDECASPGPAISVIAEAQIALAYLGTGPNIPDDLSVARADVLLADLAAATDRAAGEELDLEVESYARALR